MENVTATFVIPNWITEGLKNQAYERVGGVIREVGSKKVVSWLREVSPSLIQSSTILSQFGSAASILNLGVSVIGFAIVIQRLEEIEKRLKILEKDVNQLNQKFDLSVYANFHAALNLARDAFTMTKPENRVNMANLAINRFLEAQYTYTGYFEMALEEDIQAANEYLSSLFLTYIAKTRCYLELEETETARRCLQEGAEFFSKSVKKFIDKAFLYLDKEEENQFYKNYSLLIPPTYLTINDVITGVLGGWTTLKPKVEPIFSGISIAALTVPLVLPVFPLGVILGVGALLGINSSEKEDKPQLHKPLQKIETMIETYRRFEAYQAEIEVISKLESSFQDWLQLTPSAEVKLDEVEFLYIIPSKPLDLQLCSYSIFEY
ncbi:MAG: hypothetical protein RMZ41_030450 [Nostoc sp. DedVER02]|uniref:hypothetical protein n=1 Tax=unclassified Nostoc TaxID=2593658 RepID=UPI002AD247AA|nr:MULTISPECIES: hypothetical protein [unclassified Nostoc]MDZ7989440.1 hypothetical protein [Nostoc sp. DedVER02]MDZ8116684.1 hypothetical protein [Nostoc sp. DedVER01b]